MQYLKVYCADLARMPVAFAPSGGAGCNISRKKPRYWLYHVWGFVKAHQSRSEVDKKLGKFLNQNMEMERDI